MAGKGVTEGVDNAGMGFIRNTYVYNANAAIMPNMMILIVRCEDINI